jgi:hypothetical protein
MKIAAVVLVSLALLVVAAPVALAGGPICGSQCDNLPGPVETVLEMIGSTPTPDCGAAC